MAIVAVTDATFKDEVINSKLPVVLLLTNNVLNSRGEESSSMKMNDVIVRLAPKYADKVKFVTVILASNPSIAATYEVKSAPVAELLKTDGTVEKEIVGFYPDDFVKARIDELLEA